MTRAATPPTRNGTPGSPPERPGILEEDPLLDWLGRYGGAKGFVPDHELDGYDPRTDFLPLRPRPGHRVRGRRHGAHPRAFRTVRIGDGWRTHGPCQGEATFEAMRAGEPVIQQGVLRNPAEPDLRVVDLLVRSDVLEELVPGTLAPAEQRAQRPGDRPGASPLSRRGHQVHDTLELLKNGRAGSASSPTWRRSGSTTRRSAGSRGLRLRPPTCWGAAGSVGKDRGDGCFERLARVDHDRLVGPRALSPLDTGSPRRSRGSGGCAARVRPGRCSPSQRARAVSARPEPPGPAVAHAPRRRSRPRWRS